MPRGIPKSGRRAARKAPAKQGNGGTSSEFHEETPGAGDNGKPVATAAQIAAAATDIMKKQSAVAAAASYVGAAFKTWEKIGVTKERIREVIAMMNKDLSQEEARAQHAERTRFMMAVGLLPVADDAWTEAVRQADLGLDPIAATGEVAEELRYQCAKKQGHAAGKKNKPLLSNRYAAKPGSIEFVGWRDGHGEGLKLRNELNPEKASTMHADDSRQRVEPDDIGEAVGTA